MSGLRYTLLSDGTSDRMLACVIEWAVRRRGVRIEQASCADLGDLRPQPEGLAERARCAVAQYPCEVLFVHRDAEKASIEHRLAEIRAALDDLDGPYVPVIPVRMTEAWFLHDESAIRQASGNPCGTASLNLPPPSRVESQVDPKRLLFEALLSATEMSGRRRRKRRGELRRMRRRVAELIDDFAPLVGVAAFDRFLADLDRFLAARAA